MQVMVESELVTGEVLQMLRRQGFRMTPQRRAIVLELMRTKGHINPADLVGRVQEKIPGVNASTVYRTLSLLDDVGVLSHAHFEGGIEYQRRERADHVHLSCSHCGFQESLSLAEAEPFMRMIKEHHGFLADLTHFAISGLCGDCQKAMIGTAEYERCERPASSAVMRAESG